MPCLLWDVAVGAVDPGIADFGYGVMRDTSTLGDAAKRPSLRPQLRISVSRR